MDDAWMLDELDHAGAEHLDADFVDRYDRKQGEIPDLAAAEDLAVLREHGLDDGWAVVDVGAGTGRFAAAVAPYVRTLTAVDVSAPMLARLEERLAGTGLGPPDGPVEIVQAGLLSYEHRREPADAVHTRNTLHQVPDTFKAVALHRIAGILRPGGILRLRDLVYDTTPDRFAEHLEGWFAGAVDDPAAGYTSEDLATHVRTEYSTFTWLLEPILEMCGFEILDRNIRRGVYAAYTCRRR